MWNKFKSWFTAWFTPIPEDDQGLENAALDPIQLEGSVDLARVIYPVEAERWNGQDWNSVEDFRSPPRKKKVNKKVKKKVNKKKNQKRKSK